MHIMLARQTTAPRRTEISSSHEAMDSGKRSRRKREEVIGVESLTLSPGASNLRTNCISTVRV
jgi:hypothetical protein